ncbi:fumarylacetoacetate hydrolase family protein [Azospirillum doebereinerae]
MRIGTIRNAGGERRLVLGATLGGTVLLLDARGARAARGGPALPHDVEAVIAGGTEALDGLAALIDWAVSAADPAWFADPDTARWDIPCRPGKMLCAGRNFRSHRNEGAPAAEPTLPTGFLKLPETLLPHRGTVRRPDDVTEMDHEVELAAIIGRPLRDATAREAEEAIFGYALFNDLSARDWQKREMQEKLLLLGKNFPGFGPFGPWIVTRDEIPTIADVTLRLTVNGEERQKGTCADMIFPFPELVAHWSRIGFAPGDAVAGGTPEGVALHRKPDPTPFYLKPGDVVRAEASGIGALETVIGGDSGDAA